MALEILIRFLEPPVGFLQRLGCPLEHDMRADAGQQHLQIDGLGDIVVGPLAERVDDVLAFVLGRHHDHGEVGPRLQAAQLLEHLYPVDFGHHDVEQHEVVRPPRNGLQRALAVRRHVHFVTAVHETAGNEVAVILVIVDDQQ